MKHGKKYIDSFKTIEPAKLYEVDEAIGLVLDTAKAKFDETIELHVRLGVDPKQADQQVRGVLVLPNGTGKDVKVLVLAKGAKAESKGCWCRLRWRRRNDSKNPKRKLV